MKLSVYQWLSDGTITIDGLILILRYISIAITKLNIAFGYWWDNILVSRWLNWIDLEWIVKKWKLRLPKGRFGGIDFTADLFHLSFKVFYSAMNSLLYLSAVYGRMERSFLFLKFLAFALKALLNFTNTVVFAVKIFVFRYVLELISIRRILG